MRDNIQRITNLAEKLSNPKPGQRIELDEDEMALLRLPSAPHTPFSWWTFFWGFAIGVALTLLVTGYYAWMAIGAVPLIGGLIKYKIKQKAGLEKKKDFSRGSGLR